MKFNVNLVFLAGGIGARIKKYTNKIPKPLLKFTKNEFLQDLINFNAKFNFDKIYILSGYKSYKFIKKYKNSINNLTDTKLISEKVPLDTGGALSQLKKTKNDIILINGDTFFDIDLNDFINKSKSNKCDCTIALTKSYISQNEKLSNLSIKKNGYLKIVKNSNLKNAGIYFFKNRFLKSIPKKKISLENEILLKKIKDNKVKGIFYKKKFIDVGSYKNITLGKKIFPKLFRKSGIILDRDGVINHDYGYVHKFNKFKFRPGVIKALKYLTKKNIYIFIVTNQAGIAKKKFRESDFFILQKKLKFLLSKKKVFIDDVQFCPHHPDGKIKKYKKKCACRKPKNGMILQLIKKWNISRDKLFMIGDKKTDKDAAISSNIKFEYVENDLFKQIRKIY